MNLEIAAERGDPAPLERAHHHVALAACLGVEEGVGNHKREFVAHLRAADSVAVDEDVVHRGRW